MISGQVISPVRVDGRDLSRKNVYGEEFFERLARRQRRKSRFSAFPQDIASLCVSLPSDAGRSISGQVIPIDNGALKASKPMNRSIFHG
jgi:NAD(P)-dependent dehydrogenase (short-subunit alcohol dehydrogenase family)